MEPPPHVHRANTFLKQNNKPFKAGRHNTKGTVSERAKGRVGKEQTRAQVKTHSEIEGQKHNLKNARRLAQQNKKEDLMRKRRGLGARNGPPRIIGIVPLSGDLPQRATRTFLLQHTGGEVAADATTVTVPAVKTRFCIFEPARTMDAVLDIAKVADVLLLVASAEHGVDEFGKLLVSCIKAQGTPAIVGAIAARPTTSPPQKTEARKVYAKWMHLQFPDEPKVLPLDTAAEAGQVYRFLASTRPHELRWRELRPYLLVERVAAVPGTNNVQVCGYLRGAPMSANQLVHLTGIGDFQLDRIEASEDPAVPRRPTHGNAMEEAANAATAAVQVLDTPDAKQEQLVSENVPDVMANEQNFDEDVPDHPELEIVRKKRVPKGTSEYQAHWILDSDEDEDESGEEYDPDAPVDKWGNTIESMDSGEKKQKESKSKSKSNKMEDIGDEAEDEPERTPAPVNPTEVAPNNVIDLEEEIGRGKSKQERALEAAKDDILWPDEVETPVDQPAHVRFARYRGLQSFRTSPWDPYENLPREYARIFQFENFARTARRVKSDSEANPVEGGQWLRLTIRNIPAQVLASFPFAEAPLLVWGLLRYEQCMSVIHFAVRRHATYTEPVQSKTPLLFHAGFRRYTSEPIFSQHNPNCDKHKFERFLQDKRMTAASVFAPITYTPSPLLIFSLPSLSTPSRLVATGALLSVDPNRIVLKKIVLTGFPFKIHKRTAVVRDMFFQPDDVAWFKPVEIYTRRGRTGHILESLGTHGLMKVQMDGGLGSDDTICMNLYKRVYPKWKTLFPVFASTPSALPAPFAPLPAAAAQQGDKPMA